jgi:hypothetical protein
MKPQEKAISLVDSYRLILIKSDTDAGEEILCTLMAKECALVAVDEIIDFMEIKSEQANYSYSTLIYYWKNVRRELDKL